MVQMCKMESQHNIITEAVLPLERFSSVLSAFPLDHVKDNGWYADTFAAICQFQFPPLWNRQRRARRGQKMRCGCLGNMDHHFDSHSRPTFPVGTIMAIACTVCAQRERRLVRVERRQLHTDCTLLRFSIFGCESMKTESTGSSAEPQWRQPYMNKQSWLCRNIIGSLVSGQLLHTARCSLSYLPGDIFCSRWLRLKTTSEKLWSRVRLTFSFAIFQRMLWIRKHPLQPDAPHHSTGCQASDCINYLGFLGYIYLCLTVLSCSKIHSHAKEIKSPLKISPLLFGLKTKTIKKKTP